MGKEKPTVRIDELSPEAAYEIGYSDEKPDYKLHKLLTQ